MLGLANPGAGHLYAGRLRPAAALMIAAPALLSPLAVTAAIHLPRPMNVVVSWGAVGAVLVVGAVGGALAAHRAPRPFQLQRHNRWWVYVGLVLTNFFVVSPLARSFARRNIAEAFRIPSAAMAPTILAGDYVYVDRNTKAPSPGEIVAFRSVDEPGLTVLKRAVAVGGDTVEMTDGRLRRNGRLIAEPYAVATDPTAEADPATILRMRAWQGPLLIRDTAGYRPRLRTWGPLELPQGTFFDLGDNRDASYDSRYYGPVPAVNVVGRLRAVYYSYEPESYRPLPFLSSVRWSRLGLLPR